MNKPKNKANKFVKNKKWVNLMKNEEGFKKIRKQKVDKLIENYANGNFYSLKIEKRKIISGQVFAVYECPLLPVKVALHP